MKRTLLKMLKLIEMIDRFKKDINVLKTNKKTYEAKFIGDSFYDDEIKEKTRMIDIWENRLQTLKNEL